MKAKIGILVGVLAMVLISGCVTEPPPETPESLSQVCTAEDLEIYIENYPKTDHELVGELNVYCHTEVISEHPECPVSDFQSRFDVHQNADGSWDSIGECNSFCPETNEGYALFSAHWVTSADGVREADYLRPGVFAYNCDQMLVE